MARLDERLGTQGPPASARAATPDILTDSLAEPIPSTPPAAHSGEHRPRMRPRRRIRGTRGRREVVGAIAVSMAIMFVMLMFVLAGSCATEFNG